MNNNNNTFNINNYATQYCPIHKLYILYFVSNKVMDETQCWQCVREANKIGISNLNAALNIAAIGKLNKLKGEKLPLPGSMSIDLSQHELIAASPRL